MNRAAMSVLSASAVTGGAAVAFMNQKSNAVCEKPDPLSTMRQLARQNTVTIPQAAEQAVWNARYSQAVPHTDDYYVKCMFGGILSCGLTHTAVVPLDVTKCNMQVFPQKYPSMMTGMGIILREEGLVKGLTKGWAPTFLGYSMQGMFKFGLYEIFKDFYSNLAGEKNYYDYRGFIYLAGSASAEFFADIALCPCEMVKVKVQTSPAGTWPIGFAAATSQMWAQRSETRFPFGSIVPLWSRQIPYTMAKFFFFEKVVELFYENIFTKPRDSYSRPTKLGITFASGYIAGVICAIVSHPADTLVSLLGKKENKGKSFGTIAAEFGYGNLMVKGLGPRIIMIGTLTGLQWWIYDTFKTQFGLGTSGGVQKKH